MIGNVARLHINVGAEAPMQVVVRTKHGVADVTITAPQGTQPMTEQGIRAALESEGVELGHFEQRGHQQAIDDLEAQRDLARAAAETVARRTALENANKSVRA
jgi:hypothetical protein